jgi:flagellar hook-associated protein 3 FlgL
MTSFLSENLSKVNEKISNLQLQTASGKRINKPSDDPEGMSQAMSMKSGLARISQFKKSASDAQLWMKTEDVALSNIQNMIREARTTALQAANPLSNEARQPLAKNIEASRESMVQLANTSIGTRFIFGGYKTNSSPFASAANLVSYNGDNGKISNSIGEGISVQINHTGSEVFNMGGADPSIPDLFDTFTQLSDAIKTDDQAKIQSIIGTLDKFGTKVNALRAENGQRLQQVKLGLDHLDQSELTTTKLLSDTEDADLSETLVHLKEQENILQATGYVTSTISKGSLLNWLR